MPDARQIREGAREVVAGMIGHPVEDSELLLTAGLIDSLSVLKMISRLEARLKVRLPADRLQPEDFDSIDLIVETVERVAQPL